jgi:hypothetical protein
MTNELSHDFSSSGWYVDWGCHSLFQKYDVTTSLAGAARLADILQ